MKHKIVRVALVVIELFVACFGLAAYLWMTEYGKHHVSTRHVSHG